MSILKEGEGFFPKEVESGIRKAKRLSYFSSGQMDIGGFRIVYKKCPADVESVKKIVIHPKKTSNN